MKKGMKIFLSMLFLIITVSITSAQESEKEMTPEQKAWMEYMTPGWAHEMMAKNTGEWKSVNKFWMKSDAEPIVSEGSAVNTMILGGRYMQSVNTGTAWGMPFEGIAIEGYDNELKVFQNIWIDNMGTGIATAEGTYDKSKNMISYNGKMVDPVSGKDMTYRQVLIFKDDNTHVLEMYMTEEGKEYRNMEITFTRKMSEGY